MSGNDTSLSWLRLSLVPGLGVSGAWRLLNHFGSPDGVFAASPEGLSAVKGIRKNQIKGLLEGKNWIAAAEVEWDRLRKYGARIVAYDSSDYPELLKQLVDPPLLLYVLGDHTLLKNPSIAIVGSRAATAYGRRVSFQLAEGLTHYAMNVVSGMALGIDTEAHCGCLHGGGKTVAVLGCGLDVVYPKQNRKLYDTITSSGAVVSEYTLGTKPEGFRFPARNRIIAGLSSGVVVVEAARKSGSLITAQMALDLGRDVFAVPGQVDSFKSEGTHWLLQQGAKLVASAADIADEYGGRINFNADYDGEPSRDSIPYLDSEGQALLDLIDSYGMSREELIEQSNLAPARVSELLLIMELEGVIEMLPGDRLRKVA